MKKTLFISVALLTILFGACREDGNPAATSTIVLTAPAGGVAFSLMDVDDVTFSWEPVEQITGYILVLSLSENLNAPVTLQATAPPFTFTAASFDAQLAAMGVEEGATALLYWSVIPAASVAEVQTQVRAMTVARRTYVQSITLSAPADGVTISTNTDVFPYLFQWNGLDDGSSYTIKFSTSSVFPSNATVAYACGDAGTYSITLTDFEELLKGFEPAEQTPVTVYWTVVPALPNEAVQTETRSFTGIRDKVYPAITLLSPAEGATVNSVSSTFPYAFSWNKVEGITSYTIKFSKSALFPATAQTISYEAGNNDTFSFTAASFTTFLVNLFVGMYTSTTLYWTVVPTGATSSVTAQTRSFTVDRVQALSQEALNLIQQMPRNVVIAHRGDGNSVYAPEETEVSFRWARNMGVEFLECDMQKSSDGVIMLLHDSQSSGADLTRSTDIETVFPTRQNNPLSTFSFAELQTLDAGIWKGAKFSGEQIPTLEDLIMVCEGYRYLRKRDLPAKYPSITAAEGRKRVNSDEVTTADLSGINGYIYAKDTRTKTIYIPDQADNGHRPGIFSEIKTSSHASFQAISETELATLLTNLGWYNDNPALMKAVPPVPNDGTRVAVAGTEVRMVIHSFDQDKLQNCKNAFGRLRPMGYLLWDDNTPLTTYSAWLTNAFNKGAIMVAPMIGSSVTGANYNESKGKMVRAAGMLVTPYTFGSSVAVYNSYVGKNVTNGNSDDNYVDGFITDYVSTAYDCYKNLEDRYFFSNALLGLPNNLHKNKFIPSNPAQVVTDLGY
jgi:glycerophosphoryl diester phosphodiesterase